MTYQICLQSIIQCVEYEFAVVKFVEQDCQKQKDICVILWMYITTPPLPPPPLSTTDIGLTTALISEEQPSLYKFKEMAILASEAFCTHLIFCNISISFQTNSCWHQKMTVCNRLSDACTNLREFREVSTNLSQAHA